MNFYFIILIIIKRIINNNIEDVLFDSIIGDNYNLTSIYHYNDKNIKIKHLTKNAKNKIICIFGVLVNLQGIIIENEMLDWLSPEYDIYCVYQKYPGKLYEYPYFRFAQWIMQKLNKNILLYLHTKGAFHKFSYQITVRKIWKNEFTNPRNKKYIQPILKNITDISAPFTIGFCTWFNGMFISKRAFDLIHEVPKKNDRGFYEGGLFSLKSIRIKGIIKNRIRIFGVKKAAVYYLEFLKKKKTKIDIIIQDSLLFVFIIIIKLYIIIPLKFFKYKKEKKTLPLKLIYRMEMPNSLNI